MADGIIEGLGQILRQNPRRSLDVGPVEDSRDFDVFHCIATKLRSAEIGHHQDRTTWLLSHDCRSLICDSRHFLTDAVYQHPVTFGIWRLNDDSDRTTLLVRISTIVMPLTVYAKWGS